MPVHIADGDTSEIKFLPVSTFKEIINLKTDKPIVVILDDFGQAPRATQAAFMQAIQEHKVGELNLPKNISFILLTNDRQDMAGVQAILEPVKSRTLVYHYQLTLEEWLEYAYKTNIYPTIPAYLRWKPEAFNDFRPTTEMTNQPCARTWTKLSKALYALDKIGHDETLRLATAMACVSNYGPEFITFESFQKKLPDVDKLLAGKATFEHNEQDPSLTYALLGTLIYRLSAKNLGKIIKICRKLPKPFQVMAITDIKSKMPDALSDNSFLDWTAETVDIII